MENENKDVTEETKKENKEEIKEITKPRWEKSDRRIHPIGAFCVLF